MKKILLLFGLLAVICIVSCGKDDATDPAVFEFTSYLIDEESILETEYDEAGESSYEIGWKFTVSADGKITRLGGLFPDAADHTVTLWDSEGTMIAQVVVTASPGELVSKKIDAVEVSNGENYTVSYNTDFENYYYKSGAIFPITLDYITVTGEVELGGDVVNFPSSGQIAFVGVPEIGFVRN